MNTIEANALRAGIAELAAAGLRPREIAKRASCALSTVYKVLGAPGPDGRVFRGAPHNRTGPTTAAAVWALAAADPTLSAGAIRAILADRRARFAAGPTADGAAGAEESGDPASALVAAGNGVDPLPAERTIRRLMGAGPAERPAEEESAGLALYAWPAWDDYAAAAEVASDSLDGEIAVLRAMVRRSTKRLAEEPMKPDQRQRLECHTRGTILALTALVRSRRHGTGNPAALDELLRMGLEWSGRLEGAGVETRAGPGRPGPGVGAGRRG